MIPVIHRRMATTLRVGTPLMLIAATVAVLLRFSPEQSSFYPECPIYSMLRLQCPGCGGTRALVALLHGHFREAIRFNALVTLILPLAVGYGIGCYRRFLQHKPLGLPQMNPSAIYAGLTIAAIFTVQRNLPVSW
jgi:hypothetical protein